MTKCCAGLLAVAVLAMVGCESKSTPGGPGATGANTSKSAVTPSKENTFTLDPPNLSTDVKQGEKKAVSIGINRGTNFDQDVRLECGQLPKGVTITPASPAIKAGDKNAQITVEADKDAALGDHTIEITGKPAKAGPEAKSTFKISVKKAD